MVNVFEDQARFMMACDQTVSRPNLDQLWLYVKLINEEVGELNHAMVTPSQELDGEVDRVQQLDALIDIMVVTIGALHSLGINAEAAWKEVMRSNLSKIDPVTGRVIKREDGKVLKPEGWQPPRLAACFLYHNPIKSQQSL